jgi:hypothetical protein
MRKKKIGNQSNERQRKKNYIIVYRDKYLHRNRIYFRLNTIMYVWELGIFTVLTCPYVYHSLLAHFEFQFMFFFLKFFSYTATTSASCMSVYSAKFKPKERQNHDAEHLGCNVKNIRRSPIIIIKNKKKLEHIASASPLWYKYRTFFFSFHVTM